MDSPDGLLDPTSIVFTQNAVGQLCLSVSGDRFEDLTVRRAFPLESPSQYISFFDSEGQEIGMLADIEDLGGESQEILRGALHRTYFLPVIEKIIHIGEEYGVIHADLVTSSGPRQIEIRGFRRNIRLLSRSRAIIEDVDGNRYELRNWERLPKLARDILGL